MLSKLILILCLSILFPAIISESHEYKARWPGRELPSTTHTLKVYDINLDLPYTERWKEVMKDFKKPMENLLSYLWIKNLPIGFTDYISYPLARSYYPELADEIKAFSDLLDISFTKLFLLNFIYDEASIACSSIVLEDSEGNVILARTLDFGLTEYAAGLAFQARYYKGGKVLYESVDIAGYVGLLTGIKANTYAFSLNEYFVEKKFDFFTRGKLLVTNIAQLLSGKLTPPYVARKAFEETKDYDSLVDFLANTETISRVHYIVAGAKKGQGAIITRFQKRVQNITSIDPEHGEWHLAQTNYVRDKPDPSWDNRRTAEIDRLDVMGREAVTKESLFEYVMNRHPTFNSHTIHTTIMQPNINYMNTTVWF